MTKISQIIKENEEEFRKVRTDAISEMFDNPKDGIYPTTKFFNVIDDNFHQSQLRLISAFKEMVEEKRKVKSQKCTECGGKGLPTECMGGADWPYKDAYNEALKDLLSSLTQIEDDTKI